MFGADAYHCPDVERCYCNLYGVCNLGERTLGDDPNKKGCDKDRCGNRWEFPPEGYDGFPVGYPEVGWDGTVRTKEQVEELRRRGQADNKVKKKKGGM